MPYSTLILDLDGTIYPIENGIWEAIAARMDKFMQDELKLPAKQIPSIREQYYNQFGTTLSGLRKYHNVNESHYLKYVHDIPISKYLKPDPELKGFLAQLPQKKWIFTNSDRAHSERVLGALSVRDLFEDIISIETFDYLNKPNPTIYHQMLNLVGNPQPNECVYVDDSARNLSPAKKLGITTVFVGENSSFAQADYSIKNIHELVKVPGLI